MVVETVHVSSWPRRFAKIGVAGLIVFVLAYASCALLDDDDRDERDDRNERPPAERTD